MRRIFTVGVVALAGAGLLSGGISSTALASARRAPAVAPQAVFVKPFIPAPPQVVGCYSYSAGNAWVQVPCASGAFIRKHFPHPEVLAGLSVKAPPSGAPFDVAAMNVDTIVGGSESDNHYGTGAYSLQENIFFTGSNDAPDGLQFTDQTQGSLNGVCAWQINISTQNYIPNCADILSGEHISLIEGNVWNGLLTVAGATEGGSKAIATVVGDRYLVGSDGRWNNVSGSILGLGDGSEAVFNNTEVQIGIEASSCLNDDGFIAYSVSCSASRKVQPAAYVSYSPGPSTQNYQTEETNNLIPVIGSPPANLPTPVYYFYGGYTAQISYVASTSGHCFSGSGTNCN